MPSCHFERTLAQVKGVCRDCRRSWSWATSRLRMYPGKWQTGDFCKRCIGLLMVAPRAAWWVEHEIRSATSPIGRPSRMGCCACCLHLDPDASVGFVVATLSYRDVMPGLGPTWGTGRALCAVNRRSLPSDKS